MSFLLPEKSPELSHTLREDQGRKSTLQALGFIMAWQAFSGNQPMGSGLCCHLCMWVGV